MAVQLRRAGGEDVKALEALIRHNDAQALLESRYGAFVVADLVYVSLFQRSLDHDVSVHTISGIVITQTSCCIRHCRRE
jgi:hypothetical protein